LDRSSSGTYQTTAKIWNTGPSYSSGIRPRAFFSGSKYKIQDDRARTSWPLFWSLSNKSGVSFKEVIDYDVLFLIYDCDKC